MLWASQVAHGHDNALKLRVYGERGALEWVQEEPDRLWLTPAEQPKRLLTRGGLEVDPEASRATRIPAGHPEGYLEGFATLYSEIARGIFAARTGAPVPDDVTFPTVADGTLGIRFISACIRSSGEGARWTLL